MKLGVQLYNFRDYLSADFTAAMRQIAQLGFDGVELVGCKGPMLPEELADFLHELDLECAGCMYPADLLEDPHSVVYEYARKVQSPAVTISTRSDNYAEDWQKFAGQFARIGRAAADNGLVFSYHNHWLECEVVDGQPAIYRMLDANDPAQVFAEPDICWLTKGRIDPVEFINRYTGRIRQVHFKDIADLSDYNTTVPLGCGVPNFWRLIMLQRQPEWSG